MGTRVTDNFSGTLANWTNVTGATASLAITTGQVESTHPSTPANMYYNADTPPADQYAQLVLKTPIDSISDEGFGPAVRIATGAQTEYMVQSNANETRCYKVVSGGFTQLGSDGAAGANTDLIKLSANGTSISTDKNGSTIIGPTTDSGIASGRYGIWSWNSGSVDILADDWEGGDFAGAPTFPPVPESRVFKNTLAVTIAR
jgi:hypothetical protein